MLCAIMEKPAPRLRETLKPQKSCPLVKREALAAEH